ncbi:acyl-CoA dehydrogenase family protein [Nocardioides sp. CCNWLW239]|uniref:acyl-CoA dehydrogenase family protein n=1 Tax=Nocardioides sp. CCNWLW239 TaxID=3128902 RepID=UPI00301A185B
MRFGRTPEQTAFADALDDLLGAADTPSAARSWADGDPAPGLSLWQRLADLGVTGLLVSEEHDGSGASPVDLAVAFERLGYHGVPGPWIESVAALPGLLAQADETKVLAGIASGANVATLAVARMAPRALDADVADHAFTLTTASALYRAEPADRHESVDATRHLFDLTPTEQIATVDAGQSLDLGTLACSAQLLGAGNRLLDETVAYAQQRRQFGKPIGAQQAVKHLLTDVRVALDFAAPLVHNASLTLAPRDVSAAKVAAGDAAYLASRTALQVHGAIGYTREFDLSLWILKVRALVGAWGTPAEHRARILSLLVEDGLVEAR